jgi:hypothetical protein
MWLPLPEMAFKDELSYFECILLLKGEFCSFSDCSSVSLFESDYVFFFTLLLAEILNQRNSKQWQLQLQDDSYQICLGVSFSALYRILGRSHTAQGGSAKKSSLIYLFMDIVNVPLALVN